MGSASFLADTRPARSPIGCVSILIGTDHLPASPAPEGIVGEWVDRGLEELHVPIGQEEVRPARVRALEAARRVAFTAREVARAETATGRVVLPGIEIERDRRAGADPGVAIH